MNDKSIVYFASTETPALKREYSLARKFDTIIDRLGVKEVVKDKDVAIKMHTGYKLNYTTIHPFLVGRLVSAIKEAGGNPFVIDILRQIRHARLKGYTEEVIGCPMFPVAGIKDNYFIEKKVNFKGVKTLKMGGSIRDADVLINLAHFKGHNSTGYGGVIKNLALGCFTEESRYAMHETIMFDSFLNVEKCTDVDKLIKACPFNLIKWKKGKLQVTLDLCNQCMRCIQTDKNGCIQINKKNFESFFEIVAIAAEVVLSEIGRKNIFNINVAFDITEYCDCWGFTTGNILPDIGFLGSKDILALDKATLDLSVDKQLIIENVSKTSDINNDPELHPLARIHGPYKDPYIQIKFGEKHNLGNTKYEIKEILPAQKISKSAPAFPKAIKLYQNTAKHD